VGHAARSARDGLAYAALTAGRAYLSPKAAVTVRSADMSTTHWSVPVQAPLHPANVDATLGVATSCTVELLGYAIAHTPASAPRVMEQES